MPRPVHRFPRPAVVLAVLMLALVAVSCARKEASEEQQSAAPPATASQPAPALTDANIAAIVVAANTIDIKNGQLASAKSKNAAVKAFAAQMITDHTSVNARATALVTKLAITPEENATSRGLVTTADSIRTAIGARVGADFDRAYVDNEVAVHQSVLETLDQVLIPGAANAELKALLVEVRPVIEAHLGHAKKVQAALAR